MPQITNKTLEIRDFICNHLDLDSSDLVHLIGDTFSISRQAVHNHLNHLIKEKIILSKKDKKKIRYALKPVINKSFNIKIDKRTTEYSVRDETIEPILKRIGFPDNVMDIWMYRFSEIVNNAIDHSKSKTITIKFIYNYLFTEIKISDKGTGIFEKLNSYYSIKEVQFSLLELFKGKFTTDPSHHSGEGIFFTSRMFDLFQIRSGKFSFIRDSTSDSWNLNEDQKIVKGTELTLRLNNRSTLKINEVFMNFVSTENFKFNKTHVRIELAEYGKEYLVSRSQAKRILLRLEKFDEVTFDFKNVGKIGPAFADELFRVSKLSLPKLKMNYSNANKDIEIFIRKALLEP